MQWIITCFRRKFWTAPTQGNLTPTPLADQCSRFVNRSQKIDVLIVCRFHENDFRVRCYRMCPFHIQRDLDLPSLVTLRADSISENHLEICWRQIKSVTECLEVIDNIRSIIGVDNSNYPASAGRVRAHDIRIAPVHFGRKAIDACDRELASLNIIQRRGTPQALFGGLDWCRRDEDGHIRISAGRPFETRQEWLGLPFTGFRYENLTCRPKVLRDS